MLSANWCGVEFGVVRAELPWVVHILSLSLTVGRHDAARWRPQDFAALMVSRGIPLPAECDEQINNQHITQLLDRRPDASVASKGAQDTHCTFRANKPVTLKAVRWELNTCRADALWERDGQKDQARARTPHMKSPRGLFRRGERAAVLFGCLRCQSWRGWVGAERDTGGSLFRTRATT